MRKINHKICLRFYCSTCYNLLDHDSILYHYEPEFYTPDHKIGLDESYCMPCNIQFSSAYCTCFDKDAYNSYINSHINDQKAVLDYVIKHGVYKNIHPINLYSLPKKYIKMFINKSSILNRMKYNKWKQSKNIL